jgi:hypothetical protein
MKQARRRRRMDAKVTRLKRASYLYDFVRCVGDDELEQLIQTINENDYDLVSVTQKDDTYTVFFRRYAP